MDFDMFSNLTLESYKTLSLEMSSNEREKFNEILEPTTDFVDHFENENRHFTAEHDRRLKINKSYDRFYKQQLRRNCENIRNPEREKLPIYKTKDQILETIRENQIVLIEGETGCGKSTQVPQFILDEYIEKDNGSLCKIACCQPRRISTVGLAERVAEERGEVCGSLSSSVGYSIRFVNKRPRDTGSIIFCTTGILLQWLKDDCQLNNFSHIILDEIHERSIETDFLLIVLRDLIKRRKDLKLILMSASVETECFSSYFYNCPAIKVDGVVYPIEKNMLEDIIEMLNFPMNFEFCLKKKENLDLLPEDIEKYSIRTRRILSRWDEEKIHFDLIILLLKYICDKEGDGAILIFLPGWDEIISLYQKLLDDHIFRSSSYLLILLHSDFTMDDQEKVFNTPPRGTRKIVISTNIAETGITIDDVAFVIDCGKMKTLSFDAAKNIQSLQSCWITKANAQQRRGRAGRTKPGKCYCLYTSAKESGLESYQTPEILCAKLENLVLKVKSLKLGNVKNFLLKGLDVPDPKSVDRSIEMLTSIHILDEDENLTLLGLTLSHLPLEPQVGKILIYGLIFSCLEPILTVVAVLDYMSPFVLSINRKDEVKEVRIKFASDTQSDHLMAVAAYEGWKTSENRRQYCKENFLSFMKMKTIEKLRIQYLKILRDLGFISNYVKDVSIFNQNSDRIEVLKTVICAGLYPNVAYMNCTSCHGFRPKFNLIIENDSAILHPKSIQRISPPFIDSWLVYYHKLRTSRVFIHDVTTVTPMMLYVFGGLITEKERGIFSGNITLMNNWIRINCSSEDMELLDEVRRRFYIILKNCIRSKKIIHWNEESKDRLFLEHLMNICSDESHELSLLS